MWKLCEGYWPPRGKELPLQGREGGRYLRKLAMVNFAGAAQGIVEEMWRKKVVDKFQQRAYYLIVGRGKAPPSGTKGVLSCVRSLLFLTLKPSRMLVLRLTWHGLSATLRVTFLSVTMRSSLKSQTHRLALSLSLVTVSWAASMTFIVMQLCSTASQLSRSLKSPLTLPLSLSATMPTRLCVRTMASLTMACWMTTCKCIAALTFSLLTWKLWTFWRLHSLPSAILTSLCVGVC